MPGPAQERPRAQRLTDIEPQTAKVSNSRYYNQRVAYHGRCVPSVKNYVAKIELNIGLKIGKNSCVFCSK
ncbi:hypothetical protein WN51_04528 [Melipona quadrifasciata]|uniref:Uncharacterized protein n=1 Tax=Melipona quadrifasciata TaxID=166423 RepID=A0A0M8ZUR2_9HYME|nr:hypothetical protein WN51_04528 [Melipona quadrifasciata]